MEEEFSMFMNSKATGSVKKDLVEMFVMCRKSYQCSHGEGMLTGGCWR